MNRLASTALIGAVSMFYACGGDDDGTGGPGADAAPVADSGPAVDADAIPDADMADASMPPMELAALCAEDGPFVRLTQRSLSCVPAFKGVALFDRDFLASDRFAGFCRDTYAPFLADGSITVDEAAIPACLAYIEDSTCEELVIPNEAFAAGSPCTAVLQGSFPAGGTCDIDAQCAGDAHCNEGIAFYGTVQCGTCLARRDTGADCSFDEQCSTGSCNNLGVCAQPRMTGEACIASADCAGSLTCDAQTDTCRSPYPQPGDACTEQADCGAFDGGLYCDVDDTATCKPLPGPGEPCLVDLAPAPNDRLCNYHEYAWCDRSDDTCKAPTMSAVGESCSAFPTIGSGALQCPDGSACNGPYPSGDGLPSGTCILLRAEGESCQLSGDSTDVCQPIVLECENNECSRPAGNYTGVCNGDPGPS